MNYDLFSLIDRMKDDVPYPWFYYTVIERDTSQPQGEPVVTMSFRINNTFEAIVHVQDEEVSPVTLKRHEYAFIYTPINPDILRGCTSLESILQWLLKNNVNLAGEKQLETILNDRYTEFFSKAALSQLNIKPDAALKAQKPYSENTIQRLMGKGFKPGFMGPFTKIELSEPFKGYIKEPTFYFSYPWSKRRIAVGAKSGSVTIR